MIRLSSKEKYPKEPRIGYNLDICRKDFEDFKERDYKAILAHLSMLVTDYQKKGLNPELIKRQKENLEDIKELIDLGNEKIAFHNFLRTFPSCLPYREYESRF